MGREGGGEVEGGRGVAKKQKGGRKEASTHCSDLTSVKSCNTYSVVSTRTLMFKSEVSLKRSAIASCNSANPR